MVFRRSGYGLLSPNCVDLNGAGGSRLIGSSSGSAFLRCGRGSRDCSKRTGSAGGGRVADRIERVAAPGLRQLGDGRRRRPGAVGSRSRGEVRSNFEPDAIDPRARFGEFLRGFGSRALRLARSAGGRSADFGSVCDRTRLYDRRAAGILPVRRLGGLQIRDQRRLGTGRVGYWLRRAGHLGSLDSLLLNDAPGRTDKMRPRQQCAETKQASRQRRARSIIQVAERTRTRPQSRERFRPIGGEKAKDCANRPRSCLERVFGRGGCEGRDCPRIGFVLEITHVNSQRTLTLRSALRLFS
jgi:hypothetical protein